MSEDLSVKYYQTNKESLQKKDRERYQCLSKKKKEKKWQYGCTQYKNLPEDEKEKLEEYRKNYDKNEKKHFFCNYKKLSLFRKSRTILKSNDEEYIKSKYLDAF